MNFDGGAGEGITYGKKTGGLGIDDLMDAPYHRLSIIDPRNYLAGTGYNDRGDIVVNYGSSRSEETRSKVVLYPFNCAETWYRLFLRQLHFFFDLLHLFYR